MVMRDFWTSQRERFSQWGVSKTLAYYLLGVAPDKLGIKLLAAYEYPAETPVAPPSRDCSFSIVHSMEEWSSQDLDRLKSIGDIKRLQLFADYFARRDECAVARTQNMELVCLCWLENTNEYPLAAGRPCVLFHNCVTVPDHRGKGLYAQTLAFACKYLRSKSPDSPPIFIDCSIVNYASKRGIQKAGFLPAGKIIKAFRRTWHWANCRYAHEDRSHAICLR